MRWRRSSNPGCMLFQS
ncbi:unnamed protein product [Linum tenue]|uniref:Uncharacterized protein n=1 Tax=Linum tenue TaxID=586396 RepID=A0AAV0PU22_9ROSI|nr:unnamed protein product [Linum tenue]